MNRYIEKRWWILNKIMSLEQEVQQETQSDVSKSQKFVEGGKKFLVDTVANVVYWHPVLGISEITFMGYSLDEMISARTGNFIFAVTTGGIYGKAMNLGRKVLNKEYYEELAYGTEREHNWKTFTKDSAVDTLTTSLYWNVVLAPWLHYVSGLSWERVGQAAIAYTVVYAFASAPYGKFLNKFRGMFEKKGDKTLKDQQLVD